MPIITPCSRSACPVAAAVGHTLLLLQHALSPSVCTPFLPSPPIRHCAAHLSCLLSFHEHLLAAPSKGVCSASAQGPHTTLGTIMVGRVHLSACAGSATSVFAFNLVCLMQALYTASSASPRGPCRIASSGGR